jgi:VWFA-related protein
LKHSRDSKDPSRRDMLLGIVLMVLGCRNLHGQQAAQSATTISVDVNVVNVLVTVRDESGKVVRDLTKDDFILEEDGRPQNLRYFSRQSDLPLTLGLLVDTSPSEAKMIGVEREASRKFFERVLRPEKDKAFLIHFDSEVELLEDLTSSREKLEKALNLLKGQQRGFGGGRGGPDEEGDQRWGAAQGPPPGGGPRGGEGPGGPGGGVTVLSDAVYLASNEVLRSQSGRKAIVLLGDGDDIGSKVSLSRAIMAAERADTLVYTIRIYDKNVGAGRGPGFGRPPGMGRPGVWGGGVPQRGGGPGMNRGNGKKNLQDLSKRTGGTYFEVSKKQSLDEIYSRIDEDLRNQYNLGYTPDAGAQPGYHRIKVSVRRGGLIVQAREGYYGDAIARRP